MLRRRAGRLPRSPLYWLHAQALRRSGQNLEAQEIARRGISELLDDAEWPRRDAQPTEPSLGLQLRNWFSGPELRGPPSSSDVRVQIEWLESLLPLYIASRSFVGRRNELETLSSYVSANRTIPLPLPLLVCGPAGVGKSALLARFCLDRLDQIRFVFLNCRLISSPVPSLNALLAEAVRQLGLQFPVLRESVQSLGATKKPMREAAREFIEALPLAGRPLIIVFDEFEALQLSAEHAQEVYSFVDDLRRRQFGLRAIFVVRRLILDLDFERFELGSLDIEAADTFLAVEGIELAENRRHIIQLTDGDPLP